MSMFQKMEGKVLPEGFVWTNEPKTWSFSKGVLQIHAPERADFFADGESGERKASAPFLHTSVEGDFCLTAQVSVTMADPFDSACLMMMADADHWAKICYEYWRKNPSAVSVVTDDWSDDCSSIPVAGGNPWLKIIRSGNCFGLHVSEDGENWVMIRFFRKALPDTLRVGVVAQAPVGKGCDVRILSVSLETTTYESVKAVPAATSKQA